MANINKTKEVMKDLLRGIRVDQQTVINKYHAYRLSDIIGKLRAKGMQILTLTPEQAYSMGIIPYHDFVAYDSPRYGFYHMRPADRESYKSEHRISL